MRALQVKALAFPETELVAWKRGHHDMLSGLRPSSFLRRILDEKIHNRSKLGRRFFGEAFVATHIDYEEAWYGSFKWLTSWPAKEASPYGAEYRAALRKHFPSIADISSRTAPLREHLAGKRPVPPDLWLIVNGEHRFIEVKLPRDSIRTTQIAGLALIATCLPSKDAVSVWVYNLYPESSEPSPIPATVQGEYMKFCSICRRPNKRLHPTAPGEIMRRRR